MTDQKKWARRLVPSEAPRRLIAEIVVPTPKTQEASPLRLAESVLPSDVMKLSITRDADVIEIAEDASEASILSAVLQSRAKDLVECPLTPPVSSARIAVARDGRLTLVAVARQGLAELSGIGEAFRWLTENRKLIAMAVPQLAIDPQHAPSLMLLADQSDAPALKLRPMLQSGQVTVQTYRTLRFSGKRGLLLEAA